MNCFINGEKISAASENGFVTIIAARMRVISIDYFKINNNKMGIILFIIPLLLCWSLFKTLDKIVKYLKEINETLKEIKHQ